MTPFFAIAPWEYPGASFDPAPHAIVRAKIGGREREIWIKMREGVIYFKDAEHARVYAVRRLFDDKIAADAERLIAVWRVEIARENYGAFLVIRRKFPRSFATGSFCLIARDDGNGWIKEHFDREWREFSCKASDFRLWSDAPYFLLSKNWRYVGNTVIDRMQTLFRDRTVRPTHFEAVAPHWLRGNSGEMAHVVRGAALLFSLNDSNRDANELARMWTYQSNSLFFNAISEDTFPLFPRRPHFIQIQDLVKWHYAFIGVNCIKVSADVELQEKMGVKTRKNWRRGLEKWGEDWRGNWSTQPYQTTFRVSPPREPSHHDKLETALTMREFFKGKWPDDEINLFIAELMER